jgi:hypothetical protein
MHTRSIGFGSFDLVPTTLDKPTAQCSSESVVDPPVLFQELFRLGFQTIRYFKPIAHLYYSLNIQILDVEGVSLNLTQTAKSRRGPYDGFHGQTVAFSGGMVVQKLETNHTTALILHQHHFLGGFFAHAFICWIREPNRKRLTYRIVNYSDFFHICSLL